MFLRGSFQKSDEHVTYYDSSSEEDKHEEHGEATTYDQLSHGQNISHCGGGGGFILDVLVCVVLLITTGCDRTDLALV